MDNEIQIISIIQSNTRMLKDLFEYFKIQHSNLPSHIFETLGEVINDLESIKKENE
jgi:hypothetical protein